MRILAFIEDEDIVKKILKHLGLWDLRTRIRPRAKAPPANVHIDDSDSQIPPSEDYLYGDPDYPIDTYVS
jgi:hypothetical protein